MGLLEMAASVLLEGLVFVDASMTQLAPVSTGDGSGGMG